MELQIFKKEKVTVEKEQTETIVIDFPTTDKFYIRVDDGRFFARGVVLFAIILRGSSYFNLLEIERGKQHYNDFSPKKDCRSEYWLSDANEIRRTALKIMRGRFDAFEEISKEAFMNERMELLNSPFE